MTKRKKLYVIVSILLIFTVIISPLNLIEVQGIDKVKLIVNGKDITELSEPIIVNDRTLVPIRFVFEEIGGEVIWDGEERSVTAVRGNSEVFLKIDSYLVKYNGEDFGLSDVEPQIHNLGNGDRTYVPLRLISNALGIGIEWDGESRTVYIDSEESSKVENFFDFEITSHKDGDVIKGEEKISIEISEEFKSEGNEIRLMLIDEDTSEGFIVDRGSPEDANLKYIPKMKDEGDRLLVAAVYKDDVFTAGDVVNVKIDIDHQINLKGIEEGKTYKTSITLSNTMNFFPKYVKYQLTDIESGRTIISGEQDPLGSYTWTPTYENNGAYEVKVLAYDENDNPYESEVINVNFYQERELSLNGVSQNMEINDSVYLIANRNFNVNETHYLIRDYGTEEERILKTIPYGGYLWFPTPDEAGEYELKVRVEDTRGEIHDSPWVKISVSGKPVLEFKGIGPDEVVTGAKELGYNSNVEMENLKYILTDRENGSKRIIYEDLTDDKNAVYNPVGTDRGKMTIIAEGIYEGKVLTTEEVEFNVYLDELYSSKPLVDKDKFKDFASELALDSRKKTGMSAALQTAQAILETGWGQYVPVDKYSGKFSYNLFGIKGEGTNGSIISNTWEVYNGVSYRVDDYFRAYNNENEAWNDHKNILLNLERYEGFREVMFDSTMGAWAVKRAGYATDPQYPIKLMNIIDLYNLEELDKVKI